MSFDALETSLASGQPLRLYHFARGVDSWRYSSGDRDITHNTLVYESVPGGIADDGIRQTGQTSPDKLTLTVPADLEVAQLYRAAPPSTAVTLTVFALHWTEADYIVIWSGNVRSVRWPQPDRASIVCAPLSEAMDATGLRLTWDRSCPHALYSAACGVSAALWRVEATVQSVDGASVESGAFAGYPDGWFTAGYLEWFVGSVTERRGIERHVGSTLWLLGGASGIPVGATARAYRGCPQTTAACISFDNLPNYGGIPHLAGVSPFDGRNPY
ncbi:MAG: phage BR0599 family protein [Azonexus sp.]|jgi:uncharacterized phage protein (TIGR02218 family)|nr:phage BR0599 family protein [Azonexus sp.]